MNGSPASGIMAAPHLPWHGGACGAVNTPASLSFAKPHSHSQAVSGYSVNVSANPRLHGSPQNNRSARSEQKYAEQAQRVGDRWHKSTGEADAATDAGKAATARDADAAKPTLTNPLRRSPWWKWV